MKGAAIGIAVIALAIELVHDAAAEVSAEAPRAAAAPARARGDGPFREQRARCQRRLASALAACDAYLTSHLTAVERDAWRERLHWREWATPLLETGQWRDAAMQRAAKFFYAAEDGFGEPAVDELRQALTAYLNFQSAVAAAEGDELGMSRSQAQNLKQALAAERLVYADVEQAVWWLAAVGKSPDLVAQARARFNGPVIVGQVHRDLVDDKLAQFQRETTEVSSLDDHLASGAAVIGTAAICSDTRAALDEQSEDLRLCVVTSGSVLSPRIVALSGVVRVTNSSMTHFAVESALFWDGERFTHSRPQATARTLTTLRRIDSPEVMRDAALRRVYGSRAAAEDHAEQVIADRAAASVDRRLSAAVDKLNERSSGFLSFLNNAGIKASRWTPRVCKTEVQIGYLPRTPTGLGALPADIPPLVGDETLSLSFHDATFESILTPQVAGAVWRDLNFSQMQRELTGGNTEEQMIGLDPQRWSVQWSWRKPVQIHFTKNNIRLRYRFDWIEIDGQRHETPLQTTSHFTVVATSLGHQFQRVGPTVVEAADPRRPLAAAVQDFAHSRFRGFEEPFRLDSLQFPAGGELDNLSGFRTVGAQVEEHWAHLRYSNK